MFKHRKYNQDDLNKHEMNYLEMKLGYRAASYFLQSQPYLSEIEDFLMKMGDYTGDNIDWCVGVCVSVGDHTHNMVCH